MDITLEGALAKKLYGLSRRDMDTARALGRQWLGKIKPAAIYDYLVGRDVVVDLLARLIQGAPEKTMADLQALAEGRRPAAVASKNGPKKKTAERAAKARRKPKKTKTTPKKTKAAPAAAIRTQMSPEQVAVAKNTIKAFLAEHPWSNRREIQMAAGLASPSAYRRIMAVLKEAKEVDTFGRKAKAVHALAGTPAPAAPPPPAPVVAAAGQGTPEGTPPAGGEAVVAAAAAPKKARSKKAKSKKARSKNR